MIEQVLIHCQTCGSDMDRIQEINDPEDMVKGVRIDVYQCPVEECKRRTVLVYEPAGGMTEQQQSWVEREVMRTGSFFPQDYMGGGFGAGGRDW